MPKFRFEGLPDALNDGIAILAEELGFQVSDDGIRIRVEKAKGNIEIGFNTDNGYIKYQEKIHFFRALGLMIEALQQKKIFSAVEEPQFTLNGVMADASRNAVMRVETVKKVIRKMAIMGLNCMMLYTEDTYTIEGEPYFGYMRGRYSYEELKKCDDYADFFGIELIPCIQTLSHLEQFLKWDAVAYLRDTQRELLVESDKTYEFLEKAIKAAAAPFRSKRIHIGMDEAHGLGLGRYLELHGYKNRFSLMTEHLRKVCNIVRENGLKPMIWSDMYFRLGSKTGNYYDLDSIIPDEVIGEIPEDVEMVYWDYYHDSREFYRNFIERHRKLGSEPVFAGGLWTWTGICINYEVALRTTNAALNACKDQGIREVFATMWGDNGGESNIFSALLGLQLYAEHGYSKELEMEKFKRRVKFCTGIDFEAYMDIGKMDEIKQADNQCYDPANPSKYLLWQDILMGLFDSHIYGVDMDSHYAGLEEVFKKHSQEYKYGCFVFKVIEKLCSVLKIKSNLGIKLKKAYENMDVSSMVIIARELLPELLNNIRELRDEHRKQWLETYKPFGWEVIDIRYGGLIARVDTAIKRLNDYLEGKIDKIEELEEKRLRYDSPDRPLIIGTNMYCTYHRITTANVFE